MSEKIKTDFLIIGAGIVGLALAREIQKRKLGSVILIEKEKELGCHASGRNSGVLHAGIYYEPHTLKAKLCLNGNRMLADYCEKQAIPLNKNGKVLVARHQHDLEQLYKLKTYAEKNGAEATLITPKELSEKEPMAKTYEAALYSHFTAVTDPKKVLAALQAELDTPTTHIKLNTTFESRVDDTTIQTSSGTITYKYLINAAGGYADKIAHQFDVGKNFILLPFKGQYKKLCKKKEHLVHGNIYPVPDLRFPFLGVHFTKHPSGTVYVGPTAFPVFHPEQYNSHFAFKKTTLPIMARQIQLLIMNKQFRNLACEEPKKYLSHYFFQAASALVHHLEPSDLLPCDKTGIRAQLIDTTTHRFVMDFLLETTKNSCHILNAVSPAFTSSFAFASHIIDTIDPRI